MTHRLWHAWNFLGFRVEIDSLVGYMDRWILKFPTGHSFHVHHILRSDRDRELHDHPWWFVSFLLGSYDEVLPETVPWEPGVCAVARSRFSFVRHASADAHRIILRRPVWTIVFTGPVERMWGFWLDGRWIHNAQYERAKALREQVAPPADEVITELYQSSEGSEEVILYREKG